MRKPADAANDRQDGRTTESRGRRQSDHVRAAQARQAALYADITAIFCKPASLPAILNECVEAIARHLDAAFARIWTLNTEQSVLELQASAGVDRRLDGSHTRIP